MRGAVAPRYREFRGPTVILRAVSSSGTAYVFGVPDRPRNALRRKQYRITEPYVSGGQPVKSKGASLEELLPKPLLAPILFAVSLGDLPDEDGKRHG